MSFLFDASQKVSSIYPSLNSNKFKSDSCLNHLANPITDIEKLYLLLNHTDSTYHVKIGVIRKMLHFLFSKPDDSAPMNRIKKNIHILKENQLMQQEQINEQYALLKLSGVETTENMKLLTNLGRELIQLIASFTTLSSETIMLTSDKNFLNDFTTKW